MWRQLRQRARVALFKRGSGVALGGYEPGAPVPLVDRLSDSQLEELNRILDWNSFIVDGRGRRFGGAALLRRADKAERIPNRRTLLMHEAFDLEGRTVLEIGCFEGAHTVGLCRLGARVTAVDSRVENVVKAIVRTSLAGCHARVFVCNVEQRPLPADLLAAEYCHHVGVLYHLVDPVSHLRELGELVTRGILLDTHYATESDATGRFVAGGETYAYRPYGEFGYGDVLSGMSDHAKWLTLPAIVHLLARAGFTDVLKVEERTGTQGPRALILARKPLQGTLISPRGRPSQ
jgi:tRNA (mo5U34)-methyltransferase